MAKFYSVGVGAVDFSPYFLTGTAIISACSNARSAPRVIYEPSPAPTPTEFDTDKKEISELEFRMSGDTKIREESRRNSAEKIISALKDGKDVAMITLGDVSVYSTCTK